ncbi:MAG: hypothetical protein LBC72_03920 [Spirochaetaceae bacterium]|jgi:hypothetical protein|nr:hypothetical protein [Spirochaetaceae bacterium]
MKVPRRISAFVLALAGVFLPPPLCAQRTEEPFAEESAAALDARARRAEKWARFWSSLYNYWVYTPDTRGRNGPARAFEVGASFQAGLAWDLYLGFFDIFKKNAELHIDFNRVLDNFSLTKPEGLNINLAARWEFLRMDFRRIKEKPLGVSVLTMDARLDANFSKDFFSFFAQGNMQNHNITPSLTVSGALFAELVSFEWTRRIFEHYTLTLRPAWYLPLVYIPKSAQKLSIQADSTFSAWLTGGVDVYIPFSFTDGFVVTTLGGLDASLCLERPVFNILDAGLEISHIPLMPSVLSNRGRIGMEGKILDLGSGVLEGFTVKIPELEQFYSVRNFWVFRPVEIGVYALYRPLGNDGWTVRPSLGVAFLNPGEEVFFNLGIETIFSPASFFQFSLFTGMVDKIAQNRAGFRFNWRRFGFYLNVDMRSQDYLRSWSMKGAGLSLGWVAGH